MAKMIEVRGEEFTSAHDAIQWTEASGGGTAILLDGKNIVCAQSEANRLAAAGVEFAYLIDHEMPDGEQRIMTIPVN